MTMTAATGPADLFSAALSPTAQALARAEHLLLQLADIAYTRAALKPMSKVLFFVSRSILASTTAGHALADPQDLYEAYLSARVALGSSAPFDDFSFEVILRDCGPQLKEMLALLEEVRGLSEGADVLGLAFNSLLRGKWESGEGLGTFLTPEEVVSPMIGMALKAVPNEIVARMGAEENPLLFGDICGGTGRFVYLLARALQERGVPASSIAANARLFDQSTLAVDFARINFALESQKCAFETVPDSLTSERVSLLAGAFGLLATNPPFGTGKYPWSPALMDSLPARVLRELGFSRKQSAADPAALFFFRNLGLLAEDGVLAIVLPDGVLHSAKFRSAVSIFEEEQKSSIEFLAAVSLPVAAFSLGGTVAKTSFLIVRRTTRPRSAGLYVATAEHIGFVKRGNRRAEDPAGNDLSIIANEFLTEAPEFGHLVDDWKGHASLKVASAAHALEEHSPLSPGRRIDHVAESVRRGAPLTVEEPSWLHISVLDVDETGLIDLRAAYRNRPVSRGLECRPGDVLVSCLNPKIWRVAVVPDLSAAWTCSPEFLVLRSKPGRIKPWELALSLHHGSTRSAALALAGGTSSSRQRVPKDQILSLPLSELVISGSALETHIAERSSFYRARMGEIRAYQALHEGTGIFEL